MSWVYLIFAGLLEICGVMGIKKVSEQRSWQAYLLLGAGFLMSLFLLRLALEDIPMSVAYAVWTGIGTVGAAIIGILFYKESKHPLKLVCLGGILVAVLGLRLAS